MLYLLALLWENDWTGVLPSLGPTAGMLIVSAAFLKYLTQRDNYQIKANSEVVDRIESIAEVNRSTLDQIRIEFLSALREGREQNQRITDTLFQISKDTVQTLSVMSGRMAELGEAVKELREKVEQMNRWRTGDK